MLKLRRMCVVMHPEISADKLQRLIQLIPTVEEQKRVFPFEKEWFTIENRTMRFFIIMTTIPMVHVRIETWLFMKELFSKVKNIWERLDIMSMAFKEIRESKKLPI